MATFDIKHLLSLPIEPKPDTATAQALAAVDVKFENIVKENMIDDAMSHPSFNLNRALTHEPSPGLMEAATQALAAHKRQEKAFDVYYDAMRRFMRDPSYRALADMIANTSDIRPMRETFDFIVNVLRPGGLPRDGPFVWCSTEADYVKADPTDQEDIKMATNIILTPPGVSSFLNLQKPRAVTEGSEPRFSLTIIFDKAAQKRPEFAALQKGIDEALKERWPGKLPSGLISPFHDGAEKAGQYEGYKAGDIFISPWTKSQPGCVNNKREDIIDWSEFYAGWIVRANVRPFAYDKAGKRGCSFFLETVQFLKPGTRLDGRKPASQSFPEDDEGEEEPV
jgi:hypothetical protein